MRLARKKIQRDGADGKYRQDSSLTCGVRVGTPKQKSKNQEQKVKSGKQKQDHAGEGARDSIIFILRNVQHDFPEIPPIQKKLKCVLGLFH
jgi:hypothetical protein